MEENENIGIEDDGENVKNSNKPKNFFAKLNETCKCLTYPFVISVTIALFFLVSIFLFHRMYTMGIEFGLEIDHLVTERISQERQALLSGKKLDPALYPPKNWEESSFSVPPEWVEKTKMALRLLEKNSLDAMDKIDKETGLQNKLSDEAVVAPSEMEMPATTDEDVKSAEKEDVSEKETALDSKE